MHRREMLIATGGVAATALSGCLGLTDGDATGAAQAETQGVERRDDRIVVTSTGEVTGDPDLAVLDVGVEASGDSASAVRDELQTRSEAVREALLDFGLDEDAVTTNRFYIREQIDRRRMEADGVRPEGGDVPEEYVTYRGTHSFGVEVADIDDVGAVIDVAVDAGADTVGRVTFTLSDERRAELREQALREAIRGARSEAETIADEVGSSLGEATVVDASQGRVSPFERDLSYAADAATESAGGNASTSVEPGDVTVTADVTVHYEMN